MTTLALVAGGIPVAIGIGEGSEFRRGLSIVLIGGLITSMLLTLLVVPVAYSLLESVTRRFLSLFRRPPELQLALATAGAPAPEIDHRESNGRMESNGAGDDIAEPIPTRADDQ